jgi:hypothetical protein
MFSLVAKPLDQFGAPKLLNFLDAVQAQDLSAHVGIHLKAKPFGILCAALPSFRQLGNYDDSGHLTRHSALPASISIPQASNSGSILSGHGSTSVLVILEAASQSQGQHHPGSPSP